VAAALLIGACGSSRESSSAHARATSTVSGPALHAGRNACRLVTTQVIVSALRERMAPVQSSQSSCSYTNSARTRNVSISTARTTPAGAESAVTSAAHTAKVKVMRLSGIGDSAIAYLTKTKTLSIATGLVAKNGTLVFLNVSAPKANHLLPGAIALARAAASHTS
jgi:hypothetical protein